MSAGASLSRVDVRALVVAELEKAHPTAHGGALVTVVNGDYVDVAIGTRLEHGWTALVAARYAWKGEGDRRVEATITKTW